MLRFFRSSNSMVIVVILLMGTMAWLHVLLSGADTVASDRYGTFMYRALNDRLIHTPALYAWCGWILFLTTALLMVYVNTRFQMSDKISYLPAFCYVLLVGGVPEIHLFNPALVATLLLMAAFMFLSESFENDRLSYNYFIAPVFISTAAFIHQYMYVYMAAVWLVIALFRPGYWREWVFSVLGFALPLLLAFSWFFLVDDDITRMAVFFDEIFSIRRTSPSVSIPTVVFMIFGIVVAIPAFWYLWQYLGSKKVVIRNRYGVLFMIAGITGALAFIVPDMIPLAWYLLAFPLSFVLAYRLSAIRSIRWGTAVLLILCIAVITAQTICILI